MARFRPRLAPTLGAALGVLLFGGLGSWQLSRLVTAQSRASELALRLEAAPFDGAAAPADPDWRRARVSGAPDWNRHLLVAPRYNAGRPGYGILVPVQGGGGAVLVDLGWVAADLTGPSAAGNVAAVVESERAKVSPRTFEGLARVPYASPGAADRFPPEADGFQRVWAQVDLDGMAQGVDLAPYVLIEGQARAEGSRASDQDPPVGGWDPSPHRRPHGEYAATWFGILVCLLGLWCYGSLRPDESP